MIEIEQKIHSSLWSDYDSNKEFPNQTPLLAHYTSITNFASIIENEEIWFANPLNMNDSEELIFGMNEGASEFRKSNDLFKACGKQEVYSRLVQIFDYHFNHFEQNHALDTYIACFSNHDENDFDGSLSMWRGYGENGSGISLVIDTSKIEPNESSPIILAPVKYASTNERLKWIQHQITKLASLLENFDKTEDILNSLAWHWVERLKVFSLFTKHKGFKEEKEWRFVYLSDRDKNSDFKSMFGYNITRYGVEPRLKLKLNQIPRTGNELTLASLIDRVLLGPTSSSELSKRSIERMLKLKNKDALVEKVFASEIPYRPQ